MRPNQNKKHPIGVFFIWYSHGLCKSVSHLHRKTLLMFCNHFGKSQISQNGNGGTPPFPRVRPNQKLKRPCGVFIFGSRSRFAARNQRLPVRKQVDLTSTRAVKSSRFPHSRRNAPCEGIECAPTKIKNTPSGYFLFGIRTDCANPFHICTAKHY